MENYKELTLEKLEQVMKDIIFDSIVLAPKIIMMRNCLTNGIIHSTEIDLKLCSNPECKSCQAFHKAIEEELKNITFKK